MTEIDKRASLDEFVSQKIDADELAARHPNCACEEAESPTGIGPVKDEEVLRHFLTSPSNKKVKKKEGYGEGYWEEC